MMNWFKTLIYARKKHHGQRDKAGKPYIFHPFYVSLHCKNKDARTAALLHDVLEDTETTAHDLKEQGFNNTVVDAVVLLTKPENEDYFHYVRRIKENPIAREVKINDLKHNMNLRRLKVVREKDLNRQKKYKQALAILQVML